MITDDIDGDAMRRLREVLAELHVSDKKVRAFSLILDGYYHCRIAEEGIAELRASRRAGGIDYFGDITKIRGGNYKIPIIVVFRWPCIESIPDF